MSNQGIVIRKYRSGDDARIEEIVKLAWLEVTLWKKIEDRYGMRGGRPWWRYKLDPVLARARSHPEQVLIAEYGGRIAGYTTFALVTLTKFDQVMDNAVDPGYRGKGIGSVLHREVLKAMQAGSMEISKVDTSVDENQASARRMYEKHGFKEVYTEIFYLRSLKELDL